MNNKEIKAKILADIAAAKEQGYTVVIGGWGNHETKCACPLGCVNVACGFLPEEAEFGGVTNVLKVNFNWIASFIDGYDGNGTLDGADVPEAWKIGEEIRNETNPIEYFSFIDKVNEQ